MITVDYCYSSQVHIAEQVTLVSTVPVSELLAIPGTFCPLLASATTLATVLKAILSLRAVSISDTYNITYSIISIIMHSLHM